MSWEWPKNKPTTHGNENIVEFWEDSNEKENMEIPPKEWESLMIKRVLVKTKKEVHELAQRKSLFMTKCKSQGC